VLIKTPKITPSGRKVCGGEKKEKEEEKITNIVETLII
jgi:hypothetical protein